MLISSSVGANEADGATIFNFSEISTVFAGADAIAERLKFSGQLSRQICIQHQLQRVTLRRLLAHTGEASEQLNEAANGFGKHGEV
jgi:hypothetical protein